MEGIQSIRNLHSISDQQQQIQKQLQQQQQQHRMTNMAHEQLIQQWFPHLFHQQEQHQLQQRQHQLQQIQLQVQQRLASQTNGHHNNINNNINNHNHVTIHNNTITNHTSNNSHNQRHPKRELIDLITCKICKGYLIDATTIDLCMHTFCRPCAVDHVKKSLRCPECNIEIKDKRYLNRLKSDVNMQNIVYKLVPGLYEKEMARRRKFYQARPSPTTRYPSEMFGDIPPSKTVKPDDMLNVCLNFVTEADSNSDEPLKLHLHCRADSTMFLLKKLISAKFGLERPVKIYHGNSEIFFDLTTLVDVATTFNWKPEETKKILNLNIKEEEEKKEQINSLPLPSSVHVP